MKVLKELFIFTIGAATGAVVSHIVTKKVDEKIRKEEQEELLSHYGARRTEEFEEAHRKSEINLNKPNIADIREYSNITNRYNYSGISNEEKVEEVKKVDPNHIDESFDVIEFEDYGTKEDFDETTLVFYADGIIATDDADMEAVDRGLYFADLDLEGLFDVSEYGDCLYIRNYDLKLDIELRKSVDTYTEAVEEIYGED